MKFNRKHLIGLITVTVVSGISYYYLNKSTPKEIEFDSLSDEEIKEYLTSKEISVPEEATRESLILLAKAA